MPAFPKATAKARNPQYVSPSTLSVSINVNGGAAQTTQNIGSKLPGCAPGSQPNTVDCSIPIDSPLGTDTFDVVTYDQANGGGNKLSQGTTTAAVDGSPQAIPIVLNGIVSSIKLAFSQAPPGPVACGSSTGVPLTVTAFDADGNVITTPGQYANPISLTADKYGSLAISPATVAGPTTQVSVTFKGAPTGSSPAVINASASGATPGSLSFDPQNYVPLNASYVYTDGYGASITETISPAAALPTNYFNSFGQGAANLPVGFGAIPTSGLCKVHINNAGAGNEGPWVYDSYVGLSTFQGKSALMLYLEADGPPGSDPWEEIYYPTPAPVDLLPEAAGDSWTTDPSYIWVDGAPLSATIYVEISSTPTGSCEATNTSPYNCSNPSNLVSLSFANQGPTTLPSSCTVGASIPTTANDVAATSVFPGGSSVSHNYDVDGIGTVCATGGFYFGYLPIAGVNSNIYILQSINGPANPSSSRRATASTGASAELRGATPAMLSAGLRAAMHSRSMRGLMCGTSSAKREPSAVRPRDDRTAVMCASLASKRAL